MNVERINIIVSIGRYTYTQSIPISNSLIIKSTGMYRFLIRILKTMNYIINDIISKSPVIGTYSTYT